MGAKSRFSKITRENPLIPSESQDYGVPEVIKIFFIYSDIIKGMSGFKFDPSMPGLRKALRGWEELALRSMWDVGEG